MKLKIAVVQFEIKEFKPEINLEKAEKFIKEASGKADIIVFPEDFIIGPIREKKEFVDFDGKYVKYFQKLATRYNISIVTGSFIEGKKTGTYNSTYYIDNKGKIKSNYCKINLWNPERSYLTSGNKISVFNTKYGKIGLIICWDMMFQEIFRKMVLRGVNIVFCPSYWALEDPKKIGMKYDVNAEINLVDSLCVTRAIENGIVFVYCNASGNFYYKENKFTLFGHSQISIPFKGCIKKLEHNKEEMFIQEIDTKILKDAEKVYRIRKDLKSKTIC